MKELLLYRHAKAESAAGAMSDHERPLRDVGREQARKQGALLAERGLLPDYIASSGALRASQTVRESVAAMRYTGKVDYLPALYDAEPETYLALLQKQPAGIHRLMIVGHNPTIEEFAAQLASRKVHLKTGSIAHVVLDVTDWRAVSEETEATLKEILVP